MVVVVVSGLSVAAVTGTVVVQAACSPQPLQCCSCSIASAAVQSTCSSLDTNIFSTGQHHHHHHHLLPAQHTRSVNTNQASLEAAPE